MRFSQIVFIVLAVLVLFSLFKFERIRRLSGLYRISRRETDHSEEPTYFTAPFPDVEEDIFPARIDLSVNLNSFRGLLWYSIDKNRNQLIMKFPDDGEDLIVAIRDTPTQIDLPQLCGCHRSCLNKTLNLTLEMASQARIQCNGHEPKHWTIPTEVRVHPDYPEAKFQPSKKNAAQMWMVNHPRIRNSLPEASQMVGCILAVRYRDRDVVLTPTGPHISRGCRDKCVTPKICNSGRCVGTFNDEPICDCTASLHMGKTCTDNLDRNSKKKNTSTSKICGLKVSWDNNNAPKIMDLRTSNTSKLQLLQKDDKLILNYEDKRKQKQTQLILSTHSILKPSSVIFLWKTNQILTVKQILPKTDENQIKINLITEEPQFQKKLTLYGQADAAFRRSCGPGDVEWHKIQWEILQESVECPHYSTRFIGLFIVLVMGLVMGLIIAVFQLTRLEKLRLRLNLTFRQIARIYGPVLESDPNQGGDDKVGDDIRTLRRHYINLKSILKSNESRTNSNFAEIVQNLRINTIKELVDTIKENDLYKSNSFFVSDHCTHILELLRLLEEREGDQEVIYNIDQTTNRLQKLILAIVNAALANDTDGLRNGRVGNFLVDLKSLKTEYEKLCEVRATLTEDGHFNRFSETKIREFFQTICKELLPIVKKIKINPDYAENKTYIDKHSDAILETLQLEAGPILNKVLESSIMQLPGDVQMLMLAIVNVEYTNSNGP